MPGCPPRGQVRGAGAAGRPPYLHADLGQVDLHGQLLAAVDIGVVGLLEGAFQLMQLVGGEGGAVPPVFLLGLLLLGGGRWGPLSIPRLPQLAQVPLALIQEHGGICEGTAWVSLGVGTFPGWGQTDKWMDGREDGAAPETRYAKV